MEKLFLNLYKFLYTNCVLLRYAEDTLPEFDKRVFRGFTGPEAADVLFGVRPDVFDELLPRGRHAGRGVDVAAESEPEFP